MPKFTAKLQPKNTLKPPKTKYTYLYKKHMLQHIGKGSGITREVEGSKNRVIPGHGIHPGVDRLARQDWGNDQFHKLSLFISLN